MRTFYITYDLVTPGQNYLKIISWLQANGGVQVQYSAWLVKRPTSAAAIRNALQANADANDRIFVVEVSGQWAGINLMNREAAKQLLNS